MKVRAVYCHVGHLMWEMLVRYKLNYDTMSCAVYSHAGGLMLVWKLCTSVYNTAIGQFYAMSNARMRLIIIWVSLEWWTE